MRHKVLFVALFVLLATVLGVALVAAQGAEPGVVQAPSALAGTAFTYQGQLKNNGTPVTSSCNLAFGLWAAASNGNQIGTNITQTIPITNGLFTAQLDFGTNAFTGDARWLQIAVRCPAGSGIYTAFSSRQPLTPTPMAFALPGLYTQQNATSPNIIGGYSGNSVNAGVYGATISGGGFSGIGVNNVTAPFGSIGGGIANTASGFFSTVAGGSSNTASGDYATVGGAYNWASKYGSAVAGGLYNTASGNGAFVGGGGFVSVTLAAGNTAGGNASTIGGGLGNTASGQYATVPGGVNALAAHYGELAYASGNFNAPGDAQTSVYVLRNSTVGANAVELFLDGTSHRLTIANNRTVTFDILVVGRDQFGNSGGYQFRGMIKNVGGTTSLVGAVTKAVIAEDDATWDANVNADNANSSLKITVSGSTINWLNSSEWVATVRTVEVGY